MAFCPSEPGSNPGTDLAFFGRMLSIYSRWALGYILRKQVIESATYSSFFFPVSYHLRIVNISIALYQRKKIKSPKRGQDKLIFKKNLNLSCFGAYSDGAIF